MDYIRSNNLLDLHYIFYCLSLYLFYLPNTHHMNSHHYLSL